MTAATQIITPAPVRKTVTVKATPARAFEVFTAGFDRWWPRSHHIGGAELKQAFIEPRVGGRWYEVNSEGAECDWGKVLAWEPPGRLMLAWQIGFDWKYDPALVTEVEVVFTAVGEGMTRVDFEHRNLERMGANAVDARASLDNPNGWGAILQSFVETVG
ncbi:MAG: ATPase [Caulobacter sp.]|nr:ATPase [Caulobacter sp.]